MHWVVPPWNRDDDALLNFICQPKLTVTVGSRTSACKLLCLDPSHRLDYKTTTMRLKKRRMIGAMLIAASVLAAILIQAFIGRVLLFQSGPAEWVSPNAFVTSEVIDFHWRYDIPLAAGFVIGLACCAWPARKPPRLRNADSTGNSRAKSPS